jgi:hypothetical protein
LGDFPPTIASILFRFTATGGQKMFSKKLRALAFFLMALMVFYVMPVNCMQDVVSALSSDESASVASSKIDSYIDSVSKQYLRLFGLELTTNVATYYRSLLDIFKN